MQEAVWKCSQALWNKDHDGRIIAELFSQWIFSVIQKIAYIPFPSSRRRKTWQEQQGSKWDF